MGQNSNIEWTHHTFNPWWGCAKVSPGCHHCYAETLANRFGHNMWGATAMRRIFREKHWAEPVSWNARAARSGVRRRVFSASMADVFEDHPVANSQRPKLWQLIAATPMLDWQLLTKRPENIAHMLPDNWGDGWVNVWLGTSVENQKYADLRIPELLKVPAVVRFLSCEPLLGPVDLTAWLWEEAGPAWAGSNPSPDLSWVIVGGESGSKARPMNPDWARSLRDQCQAAGVPFHFKQWGEWMPITGGHDRREIGSFVEDSWIPDVWRGDGQCIQRVGKKAAGRLLDGRTWSESPQVEVSHV